MSIFFPVISSSGVPFVSSSECRINPTFRVESKGIVGIILLVKVRTDHYDEINLNKTDFRY